MKLGYSKHQQDVFFKPLRVGEKFKFTEYNPGPGKNRFRKFMGNVVEEYEEFYLLKVNGHKECILKNDLYTDRYSFERV
ncbi:hypothetical protein SAMN00017477_1054 [Peptoniphilus asaccharolyticus DSM 20463]|uniref:Uncharacterized protein n=1 Tax=Peptoniphilus asaccharolyticus DSM 20463 TaxID=573058 RepID=A0A1W1V1M9_PEPAS|nr:hypothetical protein [Peptoniphilus asaccharolyticus]MBL7575548.1 hypothetical protein [Peptoniphilus asaccharolyticus]SMB87223.1 hypothetical protein SAMN00017477_1054 [Peptoniphilus asaccharolyticus DSM 20463]